MSVVVNGRTYKVKVKKSHIIVLYGRYKTLDLKGKIITDISKIKGLGNLHDLEWLDLTKNKISEIKGLDVLINLKFLNLSTNLITEIKGLDKLSNLVILDLGINRISEL